MIVKSTQFSLWLQCILFDNKLSIYLSITAFIKILLTWATNAFKYLTTRHLRTKQLITIIYSFF